MSSLCVCVCVVYLWCWSFAALVHRSVMWCQRSLQTRGGWGGRGSVSTCPTRCGTTSGGRGTARSRSPTNANAGRRKERKVEETWWQQGRERFTIQKNGEGEIKRDRKGHRTENFSVRHSEHLKQTDQDRGQDIFCEASRCGSRATECQGWHQRKRRQLTLPQHCLLAGCDVQGSCYIRAHKTVTLLHLFQGPELLGELWAAVAASQNVLRTSLSEFNSAAEQRCSWEEIYVLWVETAS